MVCIYGLVARGVVFAITGVLFAYAGFWWIEQAGSISEGLVMAEAATVRIYRMWSSQLKRRLSAYITLLRHDTGSFGGHRFGDVKRAASLGASEA